MARLGRFVIGPNAMWRYVIPRDATATVSASIILALAPPYLAPHGATAQEPPAARPAAAELSEQQRLRAQGPGGGLTPGVALPPWPETTNRLARSAPVTDAMLANPAPGDWLSWRGTHDGLGFSPLTSIDKNNVGSLQLAWSLSLPAGPNTATPLVHDGVIYVHSFGDHVQALDAATGDELWHYARELPSTFRPTVKRNMALYGDKLYVGTSDVHVVALDAKTGAVAWDATVAAEGSGFGLSGGPLAARGKIMQGVNGQAPGGAYIVALDAESGEEAWRFYSIARPGDPGGDSWNGLPLEKRTGGSVWTAGSYDAERNLAFFGPAPTYDTGPLRDPIAQRGVTNDALYTNATIALEPDTGTLVWHFQHVPNDQWDFDWAFERQIVTLPIDGRNRRVVLTAGKEAIYDVLDLDDGGRYLFSMDLGLQNFITAIDPRTGEKTVDPRLVPSREEAIVVCPHAGGAKSWVPASINPATRVLFVPLVESCMDLTPVPQEQRGSLSTGVRWTIRPPLDGDGRYGRIQAIDLATREVLWTERQRAPQTTGVLATAGGLVFAGALDRAFTAYDDATGKALWQAKLNDVPSSAPISYAVAGKQYVAMTVGHGSAHALTFPMLTPEIDLPIVRSATIWVFALPSR
jgi:alcohol dehydrogenase (cytochrome c)